MKKSELRQIIKEELFRVLETSEKKDSKTTCSKCGGKKGANQIICSKCFSKAY